MEPFRSEAARKVNPNPGHKEIHGLSPTAAQMTERGELRRDDDDRIWFI